MSPLHKRNSESTDRKKPSPIGCLVFLAVVIVAFVYLPTLVAFLIAFGLFGGVLLISEIGRQYGMVRLRNQTNDSTIAAAPEGFAEVSGKIENSKDHRTWLTNQAVDFYRITVTYNHFIEGRNESVKATVYEHASENKKIKIQDGSESCWILFHAGELDLHKKGKNFKAKELKALLTERPLDGFPVDKLDDIRKVRVTEEWIEKDEWIRCYGYIQKVQFGKRPQELVDIHSDELQSLVDRESRVQAHDWEEMESGSDLGGHYKLMTSRYVDIAARDIRPVIITTKDQKALNQNSYIQMALMFVAFLFLESLCLLVINSEYPELWSIIQEAIKEFANKEKTR